MAVESRPWKRVIAVFSLFGLALAAVVAWGSFGTAQATHSPANKVVASGTSLEVTDALEGPVELMSARLKTSSPTDLMLQVTAECALWTDVATTGNDSSTAIARVEIWIEIDGEVVPVSSDDTATGGTGTPIEVGQAEKGRVVFCNRAYQMTVANADDEDLMIKMFNRTRNANAFNWLTLNVGSGQHEIKVFGSLTSEYTANAFAKAAIGKRTLIVEPTKLANDASI